MKRWIALLVVPLLAGPMLAWSGLGAQPAAAAPAIHAREVVGNLHQPVAFTFGPGRRIWYVEKTTGGVRVHDLDTDADHRFVRVGGVNGAGERGMLGIALHPNFPHRPFVYLYVTRSAGGALRNQILRYRADHGRGAGRRILLSTVAGGSPYHNGGRILFGPDGMLYAIVGDAHDSANAQDLSNEERGKIVRMTPGGGVPNDNPFGDLVWAYGIRNSFGFAFDPRTDAMWETENGPECNDEVNRIVGGDNYAWGPNETCSGASPGNTNQDGPNPRPARAVLREHDRDHRHRVLRRLRPRTPERRCGVRGSRQQRRRDADPVQRPAQRDREPLGRLPARRQHPVVRGWSGRTDLLQRLRRHQRTRAELRPPGP